MEWLLIAGAVALVILVTAAALIYLRERRSGTVRAALPPMSRHGSQASGKNE